jgi:flagellar biosynthesis/type III secretory pathway M-ring protein FliF/YscJ
MVSMMVRRGAPAGGGVALAAPMLAGGPTVFDVSEKLAGEAAEGRSMLDGMELDEDAIRAQQMLEQVSSMVKENPDGAASLVKRWLNRS